MAITKQDFEEMLKKTEDLVRSAYIEASDEKEHTITLQEITGAMDNLEKRSLELTLKKRNLNDHEEIALIDKVGNIFGLDLILTKKVMPEELKDEEKNARTVKDWVQNMINRGTGGIIKFWNKELEK